MTLRTATRVGLAGSIMPFVGLASYLTVATIAGVTTRDATANWDLPRLLVQYVGPAAELAFLVVLYRSAKGEVRPSRFSDAAVAAAVLVILSMAANLRWTEIPRIFSIATWYGREWMTGPFWLIHQLMEPVAWLMFLVTFVRSPAPPVADTTRRAAIWLALVMLLRLINPVVGLAESLMMLWWFEPVRRYHTFFYWNNPVLGMVELLHWLLLAVFAAAIWRMGPRKIESADAGQGLQ